MVLLEGRLFLAIEKYIVEFTDTSSFLTYLKNHDQKFMPKYASKIALDKQAIKLIEVDENYKFISFLDIGNGKFAMMLQH